MKFYRILKKVACLYLDNLVSQDCPHVAGSTGLKTKKTLCNFLVKLVYHHSEGLLTQS